MTAEEVVARMESLASSFEKAVSELSATAIAFETLNKEGVQEEIEKDPVLTARAKAVVDRLETASAKLKD